MTSHRRLISLGAAVALAVSGVGVASIGSAQAVPVAAHCGREPAGNNDAFMTHGQLTRALESIASSSQGTVTLGVAGHSNEGREIYVARAGHGDTVVLVQSQIHGNEMHGTEALLQVLDQFAGNSAAARELREGVTLVAVPRLNADGAENDHRQNRMTWDQVVEAFPQLSGSRPAWNYNTRVPGFDVNRDFNPDLDYVPSAAALPGSSAGTGWYLTPEAQTMREVYRALETEFGTVDYFVDLHGQGNCYVVEGTDRTSPLSISGRFIADPTQHGDWPKFDYDASRRANLAIYDALQSRGASGFGDITLYPQDTNLPGTALGSFALRGSATVLFETSSQTQLDGHKRNGMLTAQVREGLMGLLDSVATGSIDSLDPDDYDKIPNRMPYPRR